MTRPFADRFRRAVEKLDHIIGGPHYDAANVPLSELIGTDDPDGIVWTPDGTITIPMPKVAPNILDEPPPPPPSHPECAVLVDTWAQMQAEADAWRAWADNFHDWWASQSRRSPVWPQRHLDAKVRDYHAAAAHIVGAA